MAYDAPFVLPASAAVRARAFHAEMNDSAEATAVFTIASTAEDGAEDGGGADGDGTSDARDDTFVDGVETPAEGSPEGVADEGCGAVPCHTACVDRGFARGECQGDLGLLPSEFVAARDETLDASPSTLDARPGPAFGCGPWPRYARRRAPP